MAISTEGVVELGDAGVIVGSNSTRDMGVNQEIQAPVGDYQSRLKSMAVVVWSRWPLVLLLGVLGATEGWLTAAYINESIETRWEASAPVSLIAGTGVGVDESGGATPTVQDRLRVIRNVAREVNRGLIDPNPGNQEFGTSPESGAVVLDTELDQVVFVATGRSASGARAQATVLRQNFLDEPFPQDEAIVGLVMSEPLTARDITPDDRSPTLFASGGAIFAMAFTAAGILIRRRSKVAGGIGMAAIFPGRRADVGEPVTRILPLSHVDEALLARISSKDDSVAPEGSARLPSDGVMPRSRLPVLHDAIRRAVDQESVIRSIAALGAADASELDRSKAYGPMADFVVDITETVVLRPTTIGFDHDGMLPLHPVKDLPTVGSAIGRILRDELGRVEGAALERRILDTFIASGPLQSVRRKSLDTWLSIAFFRIHLARFPRLRILHLVSPGGYFQVLVDANRFDAKHVSILADEVLPLFVEDLERQQRAANRFGSQEAGAMIDRAIMDAHAMEDSLADLLVGADPRARLNYPWLGDSSPDGWIPRWEEDLRATLAPMQRLGLLAVPVLTDEELALELPTVGSGARSL